MGTPAPTFGALDVPAGRMYDVIDTDTLAADAVSIAIEAGDPEVDMRHVNDATAEADWEPHSGIKAAILTLAREKRDAAREVADSIRHDVEEDGSTDYEAYINYEILHAEGIHIDTVRMLLGIPLPQ
ncbi:hypothetical protein [Pengzhenrongella sp.]|uniref:hypothetical protein n=1 Tax=Pengzhenrongella sp. TaxID=2888820 RepID=UPI002F923F2A